MTPDLKPMTLSFLAFPPELRNRVYELLLAETCKFNRAISPSHHVPEDGRYALGVYSDDESNDDSDTEMDDVSMTEEEAMELEERSQVPDLQKVNVSLVAAFMMTPRPRATSTPGQTETSVNPWGAASA